MVFSCRILWSRLQTAPTNSETESSSKDFSVSMDAAMSNIMLCFIGFILHLESSSSSVDHIVKAIPDCEFGSLSFGLFLMPLDKTLLS
jgi:hypothetical protein